MKRIYFVFLLLITGLVHAQTHREFTVDVTYDGRGRIATIRHPMTGIVQSYTYNHQTGNETVTYGNEVIISETRYNAMGQAIALTIEPHGPVGEGRVERQFDLLGRMTSNRITIGGVERHRNDSMVYNAWGFLASEYRADEAYEGSISYTYGSRGELASYTISGQTVQYIYDTNGNLTSRGALLSPFDLPAMSATYDPATNRNTAWTYDAGGKVLTDDRYRYQYNELDRVQSITSRETGTMLAWYTYNGMGERVRAIIEDRAIYYIRLHNGLLVSREIWESRPDGGAVAFHEDYIYHNGQVILSVRHKNGVEVSRTYQYRDRMGNSAYTITKETGMDEDFFVYAPYGSQIDPASGKGPLHQYTGHERDQITGLDYMRARYCDGSYGRFNRPDPGYRFNLASPFSFNMYAYAQGNPVNAWDPNGEAIETAWDLISLGTGLASLGSNLSQGNYWSAFVDGVGVVADGVAVVAPFVPAGASFLIKGARGSDELVDLATKTDDLVPALTKNPKVKAGGIEPVLKGQAGEKAAGITGKKETIKSLTKTAEFRVPDELTEVSLREIKNVTKLHKSRQLTDFLLFSQQKGLTFILEVRKDTKLTRPLQDLVDQGLIDLRRTLD